MTEPFVLDGRWDGDFTWIWSVEDADDAERAGTLDEDADDGCYVIDLDDEASPLIDRVLATGSTGLDPELEVHVSSGGEPEVWDNQQLRSMIDGACEVCRRALEGPGSGRRTIDAAELTKVAQAATLLAALWGLRLESGADDPENPDDDVIDGVDAIRKIAADCEYMLFARIRPRRNGTFALHWREVDRQLVSEAVTELRAMMSSDDPSISRLFPSAYGSDADRNAGWDALARGELIEKRLEALGIVEDLLVRKSCSESELGSLMRSINDARLVLGTRLDVGEEHPPVGLSAADRSVYLVYEHLGYLLSQTIRAMRTTL